MKREISSPDAMEHIGAECAKYAKAGLCIFLQGDLGAGKTTFARGFLRGLGHQGKVKSPTYTLVEPYEELAFPVYHFDLYRLSEAEELEAIGARDYFDGQGLCLIEWPEKAGSFLKEADLYVIIEHHKAGRLVEFNTATPAGEQLLSALNQDTAPA